LAEARALGLDSLTAVVTGSGFLPGVGAAGLAAGLVAALETGLTAVLGVTGAALFFLGTGLATGLGSALRAAGLGGAFLTAFLGAAFGAGLAAGLLAGADCFAGAAFLTAAAGLAVVLFDGPAFLAGDLLTGLSSFALYNRKPRVFRARGL
jgi:hypothetical protein